MKAIICKLSSKAEAGYFYTLRRAKDIQFFIKYDSKAKVMYRLTIRR